MLLGYLALLIKWNKAYNLTAVRDPDEMVSRHLLDSLSVMPFIENGRWLDVGSGGGMPGIPLAILFLSHQVTCLDSNGKKTRFLTQVKLELAGQPCKLSTVASKLSSRAAIQRNCFPGLSAAWRTSALDPPWATAKPVGWQ